MACHATSILENVVVVLNLAEALTGVTRTVATSARQRTPPAPPLELLGRGPPPGGGCLEWLLENNAGASAIVFGREDSGLTNEELSFAQRTLKIPSDPACSSLNLSHAVAVVCYELSREAVSPRGPPRSTRVQDDVGTSPSSRSDVSGQEHPRATAKAGPSARGSSEQNPKESENLDSREPFDFEKRSPSGTDTQTMESERESAQIPGNTFPSSNFQSGQSQGGNSPGREAPSGGWQVSTGQSEASGSARETAGDMGLGSEGPVEEAGRRGEAGWRRMRRLDKAQSVLDVADGADVEDALKQADALLQKMGFYKGGSRGAKLPKLRQLLLRASPTNTEVALLRAILRRMDWFLTKALENDQQGP